MSMRIEPSSSSSMPATDVIGEWPVMVPSPSGSVLDPSTHATFSVIIPTYGPAPYLCDAVRSALTQSHPVEEIIVVDDGSPQPAVGVLGDLAAEVRVIRIDHRGLPAARNAGIAASRGSYIAFLDDDDLLEPRYVEAVATLAAARPDLAVITTDSWFLVDGKRRGTFYEANEFPVTDQRAEALRRCFLTTKTTVRRQALAAVGGFDETASNIGEDWDCWIRIALSGGAFGLIAVPLADYRMHPRQMSADRSASLSGRLVVMERARFAPGITPGDLQVLADALPGLRRRVLVERVSEALAISSTRGRAAWFRSVRQAPTARFRMLAMLGMLAPRRARALALTPRQNATHGR